MAILLNLVKVYTTYDTYDMFTGSMLTGVHVYTPPVMLAPSGREDSRFTVTLSPSGSVVLTLNIFVCSIVTLNCLATVMLGLPLAVR